MRNLNVNDSRWLGEKGPADVNSDGKTKPTKMKSSNTKHTIYTKSTEIEIHIVCFSKSTRSSF